MRKNLWLLCLILTLLVAALPAQAEAIDAQSLSNHLTWLTGSARGAGYPQEKAMSDDLVETLSGYGYEASQQPFSADTGMRTYDSINTIAVRKADSKADTADILIISSHLDSKPTTVGANDNASGTAVLMEVARVAAAYPTDTELRFIAFGAEEDGLLGSAAYAASLTEEEKARLIGAIQLDMLGHVVSEGYSIGSATDEEMLVGQLLNASAQKITGAELGRTNETMSDHTSFMRNGIPAVLLEQNGDGFENHTILDDLSMIDMDKLNTAAEIVLDTVLTVMDASTENLAQQSRDMTDFTTLAAVMPTRKSIDFGLEYNLSENAFGILGEKLDSIQDGTGATVDLYRYNMKWFGMDEALPTIAHYREGYLDSLEIETKNSGYTARQMIDIMTENLGDSFPGENAEGGTSTCWSSWVYRKFYELIDFGDHYTLTIFNDYEGDQYERTYDIVDGAPSADEPMDARHQKIYDELVSKIIRPEDMVYVGQLSFYSDGLHFVTAKTTALTDTDNSAMALMLDTVDILDEEDDYRNFLKSMAVIVHEFGHVLSLNGSQVTLGVDGDIPVFYDQSQYAEDSYMRAFFGAFCEGMDSDRYGDAYLDTPDHFVSSYAAGSIAEDFADSFMAFVLGPKQEGKTMAEEKVNFFYQYDEMIARRDFIRASFGLGE